MDLRVFMIRESCLMVLATTTTTTTTHVTTGLGGRDSLPETDHLPVVVLL
jgi:hypothetical protein